MKIPPHATRIFKGIIFDVYHWKQELFDGTTATFEALKRPGTVLVIPLVGDRIVLAHDEQPGRGARMTFLGGRQEEGEDPLEAAGRELLEESGLASDDWKLLRTYEPAGKIDWTISLFVARDCKKAKEQMLDAGERIELVELDFETFIEKVSARDFWDQMVSNDVFRMRAEGKIDALREEIFDGSSAHVSNRLQI
ncbi:NUDIX hydrolase [Candidatus Uhrbacteria bacterium]|nr:NUDIX hydrolase [Candidatus Uhrbacteria bacterium]